MRNSDRRGCLAKDVWQNIHEFLVTVRIFSHGELRFFLTVSCGCARMLVILRFELLTVSSVSHGELFFSHGEFFLRVNLFFSHGEFVFSTQ